MEVVNTTVVTDTIGATASQTAYGVRTYPLPIRQEISVNFAQGYCNYVVDWFKGGRPTVLINVNNYNATRLTAALAPQISDRIRVIEAGTAIDLQFWVDRLEHIADGPNHSAIIGAEKATTADFFLIGTDAVNGPAVLAWV